MKTAAAIVRTKLKKASKAFADAQAAGHDNTDKLQAMVTELEQRSEAAAKALADFESNMGLDPEAEKLAQVTWAKANAQVRKLTKAAPDESASDTEKSEHQTALTAAQATLDQAKAHLDSIKNPSQEAKS